MAGPLTSRDIQRVIFVESLHKSLKKQDAKLLQDHKRFASVAASYLNDGLNESESVELLMIDGLNREAAEGYVTMAMSGEVVPDNTSLGEYSFRFQDTYGDLWTSCDIGRTVFASNDEEAWEKAQKILEVENNLEAETLLSIVRIT